ncbi:MAG: ABC-three component system protein [Arcobacteraceae bacterium]
MAKEEHSAIPSWSGYIYQGKVAIYHVLRIIKDKLDIDSNCTFDNYDLEVEWQEDFAILIDGVYDTLHQVKAYEESSSPTFYNKALSDLYAKLSNGIGVSGWLNIWNPINFTNGTTSKDFSELKNANKGIYSQDIVDKIDIYEYCNGNKYCNLDEIDLLIVKKIEEIYSLKTFDITSITDEQYKCVKSELYIVLDTHILEVHKDSSKKKDTIPFNSILNIFKNNYEEYSLEYEYIKVKNNFFEMIHTYCQNSRNCDCSIDLCNNSCDLFKIEKEMEIKTAEEVYKIILKATPHYKLYNDLLDSTGLLFSLIKTFHTLNKSHQTSEYLYKKDNIYLPTTIHTSENIPVIAKNILDNKELDSIIPQYEINVFISKDVYSEDILKDARDCKNVKNRDIDELFGVERRSAINTINQIQIKPLDNIKGELQ